MFGSTAANTGRSPLLSIPPELRSRIYKYVFAVGVIHVDGDPTHNGLHGYKLYVCHCPEVFESVQPRISTVPDRDSYKSGYDIPMCAQSHRSCTTAYPEDARKPLDQCLHLDLLQTCRQIYHEAVLVPISVNGFYHIVKRRNAVKSAMPRLFEAMVPAQVAAIKTLHLVCVAAEFPARTVIRQLKGVEHLEIQLAFSDVLETRMRSFNKECMERSLESRFPVSNLRELATLPLRSLRITSDVKSDPMCWQISDTSAVSAWHRRLEAQLLALSALAAA